MRGDSVATITALAFITAHWIRAAAFPTVLSVLTPAVSQFFCESSVRHTDWGVKRPARRSVRRV
jgi:hypothetical protein